MEPVRPMKADEDEAGRAGSLQPDRVGSVYVRVAGARRPTHRANPATRIFAPNVEQR